MRCKRVINDAELDEEVPRSPLSRSSPVVVVISPNMITANQSSSHTYVFIWLRMRPKLLRGVFPRNDGRFYLLTQLLIAGIEPNPGPVANPCSTCARPVAKTHRSVRCSDCCAIRHIACANVSPTEYKAMNGKQRSNWICFCCALPNFDDSFFNEMDLSDHQISSHTPVVNSSHFSNPFNVKLPRGLKIGSLNIQGLKSTIDSLRLSMADQVFDLVGVSETNLSSSTMDSQCSINGYNLERKDGSSKWTHGIVLYIADNLVYRRRCDLEKPGHDALWCEVHLPKPNPS